MTTILGLSEFATAALASFIGILAAARITRLVVADSFPLSIKLRVWWADKTHGSLWEPLMKCPWCFGMWATFWVVGTAAATQLHWAWWVLHGTLAASYAVSWIVFHDED